MHFCEEGSSLALRRKSSLEVHPLVFLIMVLLGLLLLNYLVPGDPVSPKPDTKENYFASFRSILDLQAKVR